MIASITATLLKEARRQTSPRRAAWHEQEDWATENKNEWQAPTRPRPRHGASGKSSRAPAAKAPGRDSRSPDPQPPASSTTQAKLS